MTLKRWLPLLGALGLMVTVVGVAEATTSNKSKTRTLTRACFWVESKGDRVTYHDVKISKLNRTHVRFCIVGKTGKTGKAHVASRARSAPLALRVRRASVASWACRGSRPDWPHRTDG